jgi:hypothetical protein
MGFGQLKGLICVSKRTMKSVTQQTGTKLFRWQSSCHVNII